MFLYIKALFCYCNNARIFLSTLTSLFTVTLLTLSLKLSVFITIISQMARNPAYVRTILQPVVYKYPSKHQITII